MKTPANTMARTDDNPALKLAQCMLTKLNPLLDWSKATSWDSLQTEVSMEREASSSMAMAGDRVEVDEARNLETSCSIR